MANCPSCHKNSNEDFGLVTCQACGQVFLVDLDGNVQVETDPAPEDIQAEDNEVVEDEPAPVSHDFPSIEEGMDALQAENENNGFSTDELNESNDDLMEASELDISEENADFSESSEDQIEQLQASNEGFAEENSNNDIVESYESNELTNEQNLADANDVDTDTEYFEAEDSEGESFDQPQDRVPNPPKALNLEDPLELGAFVNSELSTLDAGLLVYDVIINNIDTAEQREILYFNLDDERFQWDAKALLKKVKNGSLRVENINPVKAQVLIARLRFEDFNVSWNQKMVTNTELEDSNQQEEVSDVE